MTLEELVIKIKAIATQNGGGNPAMLDTDTLVELILPRVTDVVVADVCKDAQQLQNLRANHTISFTSGVGTLPTTIKEEFIESMYSYGAASNTNVGLTTSYKRDLIDYGLGGSSLVATFSVQNGNIYYRAAGGTATAFTGSLIWNAVTLPTLPAASGDTVVIKANILEQVIALTVAVITGEVPLGKIGLDYTSFAQEGKSA